MLLFGLLLGSCVPAQTVTPENSVYKKRVLEGAELQILGSYYRQEGSNAAVTGGRGTEELTDVHPTVILAVPLNDDDVLTANVGVSAYTSASSSNVNPFDGNGGVADPFQASTGASREDVWINGVLSYAHSSDDRNTVWTVNVSGSNEYDYRSFGFGGGITRLFNEKNTEVGLRVNAYLDNWTLIYPVELRDGSDLLDRSNRDSYNVGLNVSQILSRNLQGMLSLDLVRQSGLLSTPFQRVYFADREDRFTGNFPLADDIERLPHDRNKLALGGRLHAYVNERIVVRTFYRFYTDDWGVTSHTLNLEVPVKISGQFTLRPAYRYYRQSAADYFAPFNLHLSTDLHYTSDYDLAQFVANQYSLGLSYTDILTRWRLLGWGFKSLDLNLSAYRRDNGLRANQVSFGVKIVND
nr:DUF3570 domain-containing protein [Lewinella sp. JB7]